MAASMQLGAINKDGLAQIFISIQDRKSKTHIRQATGLYINASIWEKRNDEKALTQFQRFCKYKKTEYPNIGAMVMRQGHISMSIGLTSSRIICCRLRSLNIWNASRYFYIN